MPDFRSRFHVQLSELEESALTMGALAGRLVDQAVVALGRRDLRLASEVVSGDEEVDAYYSDIHRRWLEIAAEQQPMAGDLRLMTALLHVTTTLERMGDQAVNIAKIVQATDGLPERPVVLSQLVEMGNLVRPMIATALECFANRDIDVARGLVVMDDPVDRLNESVTATIMESERDSGQLEYAVRMILAARALERVGDQSVDIGEQVVFFVTGHLEEFNEDRTAGRGPTT